MTVRELIEKLAALPPDLPIYAGVVADEYGLLPLLYVGTQEVNLVGRSRRVPSHLGVVLD